MAHSNCGWTHRCAGKTARFLDNACHTWVLQKRGSLIGGAIWSVQTSVFTFWSFDPSFSGCTVPSNTSTWSSMSCTNAPLPGANQPRQKPNNNLPTKNALPNAEVPKQTHTPHDATPRTTFPYPKLNPWTNAPPLPTQIPEISRSKQTLGASYHSMTSSFYRLNLL